MVLNILSLLMKNVYSQAESGDDPEIHTGVCFLTDLSWYGPIFIISACCGVVDPVAFF